MAWVTLVVSLGLVVAANHAFYEQASKFAEHRFDVSVKEVMEAIDERMNQHAQILLGGAGLFNASASVDRLAWQRYVESLRLDQYSQGVQGVGYAEVTAPEQLANRSLEPQSNGHPSFKVYPTGKRDLYSAIVYLEPLTERNQGIIGHDMLTQTDRSQAMFRAAETGLPSLSNRVNLRFVSDSNMKAGFLMFMPVYRKHKSLDTAFDRRQALQGFVFLPFRAKDLLRGLLGEGDRPLKFQIYDGLQTSALQADALLFDSNSEKSFEAQVQAKPKWTTSREISIYGRDWTVRFWSDPAIQPAWIDVTNRAVLALGTGLSLLFTLFVVILSSRRNQAETMALQMTGDLETQTQELRASQKMLDAIVENIPAGVFVKDAQEFRYQRVNRAWREMHERNGQDLIGKTVHEVFPPNVADIFDVDDRTAAAAAAGKVHVFEESRVRTPFGNDRVLRTMKVGVQNETGEMSQLLGISMDITEQVADRVAIKENEQMMRAIFDNVADGIITLNHFGNVNSMNRASELMFGYTQAELKGQSVKVLLPPKFHDQADAVLEKTPASFELGSIGRYQEIEGKNKYGHTFPLDLALTGSSHLGMPLWICLIRDISLRKKSEQMKATFVATVSHELRTPLTSINGALGLVCGGVLGETSPKAKAVLDIAYKNSNRLTLLINDLLDLEKIDAGKMRINMSVTELTPLVQQVIAMAEGNSQRQQVLVQLKAPSESVHVLVDPSRLQQVLGNLLSNAVKYSNPGGLVEVSVSVDSQERTAQVAVTDHGPGIPSEFRARIFQKFSQADDSDTRAKGGSGLGLAISKELMESMNGLIGYESVQGQGARFHFVLPVCSAPGVKSLEAIAIQDAMQKAISKRILVVEDNPTAASDLFVILSRAGYVVDIATTAAMALERIQSHRYAAITLDMVLPDQSGVALVRSMRARPELDEVPILVISTATEMAKLALQDEVFDLRWLTKPADENQLLEILNSLRESSDKERKTYEA